jgi:hypothetical protein
MSRGVSAKGIQNRGKTAEPSRAFESLFKSTRDTEEPRHETLSCRVCGADLPLPEPDEALRGGRRRMSCSARCRYRLARRNATLAKLRRWARVARSRENEALAVRFESRAGELAALPWRPVRG